MCRGSRNSHTGYARTEEGKNTVVVAGVGLDIWAEEAMTRAEERFLLGLEVGELKEARRSSEDEVAKLRAELREVREKADWATVEARNMEKYHVEKIRDLELCLHDEESKPLVTRVLGLTYAPCMDTYTNT